MVVFDKIKEIAERRKFNSFWEAYDYFNLASYSELESLQIAAELFDGDVWKNVINAAKRQKHNDNGFVCFSGATYISDYTRPPKHEPDDIDVEIFVLTESANPKFLPIYRAYTETRKYNEIPELEAHIKIIRTTLTTELAIRLFNDGQNRI